MLEKWDIYEAWLYQIEGIGRQKMKLIERSGVSFEEIYRCDEMSLHNILSTCYGLSGEAGKQGKVRGGKPTDGSRQPVGVERTGDAGGRPIPAAVLERDCAVILAQHKQFDAQALYEKTCRHNINYVNHKNAEFPRRLLEIPDAPYALYRKGQPWQAEQPSQEEQPSQAEQLWQPGQPSQAEQLWQAGQLPQTGRPLRTEPQSPVLAVIGARMCSEYGKYMAEKVGRTAAEMGFEVVSGLARGVDGIAQNAARAAGGSVTAVLGCGVDICYPPENRTIYETIPENGRLYSEYAPGTPPNGGNFPPRNRIISGLADAVVVVEAKRKSGTLITVDMALEQGRDVYALPGRLTDPMSYGCNRLIAQGATGIYDLEETLAEIRDRCSMAHYAQNSLHNTKQNKRKLNHNIIIRETREEANRERIEREERTEKAGRPEKPVRAEESACTNPENHILSIIDVEPKSVQKIYETICQETEISIQALQAELLRLELEGKIAEEGGHYHRRM